MLPFVYPVVSQSLTVASSLPVMRCPSICGFQLRPYPSFSCPTSVICGRQVRVLAGMSGCFVLSKMKTLPSAHMVAIRSGFCGM